MRSVLRWGRSAYETDTDMAREESVARSLGLGWALRPRVDLMPSERADALVVTSKVSVTGDVLDVVRPSVVITTTSGYEHLDLQAHRDRGVPALRCPLARRDAVVEHTLEALIRLMRRLPEQEQPAHEGRWARKDLPALAPRGLAGSTIGVVGLGVIGSRVVELLTALGASVIGIDPSVSLDGIEMASLEQALPRLDALTLHASLPDSARGLVGAEQLRALPAGAIVVNTARGDLLDPIAAAELVQDGHLGGLACDVFPQEPWPHLKAYAAPNLLLTPHASGFTHDLGRRVARDVQAALTAWVEERELPWRVG